MESQNPEYKVTGSDISDLQFEIQQFSAARDWKQFHDPKNLAMAIAVEVGELMEHFRWSSNHQSRNILVDPTAREAVEHELADVMILLLEFASETEIDIATVVRRKLAINASRYPVDKAKGSALKYDRLNKPSD
jgi:NTP pyrophosphatase (non-canonical NTP hydrolase)